jgi:hypothetical protein
MMLASLRVVVPAPLEVGATEAGDGVDKTPVNPIAVRRATRN